MAKILVADDNSNIQKMVGLALKDQGIDVVAVGNGEAAVRKISDLKPDLVLADVFMPVRTGYEVCEFVKSDSKLSHIPVILLVGAFDPLDEQEAQRVGADGVLKKPFVPPDPLISMVRSALARAGVVTMPEPTAARPPAAASPVPFAAPSLGTIPFTGGAEDSPAEAVAKFPEPVSIPQNSQALAFGSLLGTSSAETTRVDEPVDDPDLIVAHRPEFDDDRAWNAPREEDASEEAAEEESAGASWRRDAGDEAFGATGSAADDKKDWRATVIASIMEKKRELAAMVGYPEAAPAEKSSALMAEKESEPELAPSPSKDWSSALSAALKVSTPVQEPAASAPAETHSAAADAAKTEAPASSWYTNQASPWDSEAQKATQLASTWDAPTAASVPAQPENSSGASQVAAPVEEAPAARAVKTPAATLPTGPKAAEAPPSATTSDPSMDAMVAKVLAQLSPDMLKKVTKELLKPVVEAIVRGEMESKK